MLVLAEFRRHSALALYTVLERNSGELAGEIVGPAMIDTAEFADITCSLDAHQVAAMAAAVDEGVDSARLIADNDNGGLADSGGDVVAGLVQLHRKTEIIPGRAFEDALLLALVLPEVCVDPERHLADAIGRPGDTGLSGHMGLGHCTPPGSRDQGEFRQWGQGRKAPRSV